MDPMEHEVRYTSKNTYSTLNVLTGKTRHVWIVLHGIGYLSRYFIRYFDEFPKDSHYIIAPQAPSKYYLDATYRRVGASWLTKENTRAEVGTVLDYLNAVLHNEKVGSEFGHTLTIFGYSQGVSVAARWLAYDKIVCNRVIFYAGRIPDELGPDDFDFLERNGTQVINAIGKNDRFIPIGRQEVESERITEIFKGRAEQLVFDGGHEINQSLLNGFAMEGNRKN